MEHQPIMQVEVVHQETNEILEVLVVVLGG
jgi:hypothetical protein